MAFIRGVFTFNRSYIHSVLNNSALSDTVEEGFHLKFIFDGIILPIIACLGLVGNILTMSVLFRQEMRSSTVLYLRALAVTDSIILVLAVSVVTPRSIARISDNMHYYKDVFFPVTFSYLYYAYMTARTCNVWITVFVSLERYIALCHPFHARRITTIRNTIAAIVSITVFSIAFNIPRLLLRKSRKCLGHEADCYEMYFTEYRKKNVGMESMYLTVNYILPTISLFLLNIRTIVELIMARIRRTSMVSHQDHDERNVSLILVLVVTVFIICNFPRLIIESNILSLSVFDKFISVSNTMFVFNSSVNFLIYAFVGSHFRKVFFSSICRRCVIPAHE